MITKHEARSLIRKAVHRVPEGEEIRHLNIMPMMDMMTILLVAMIFQLSTASAMSPDVDLPFSDSLEEFPETAVTLTIAQEAILVEGSPIVAVKNGDVDSSEKEGGTLGIKISKLSSFLGAIRGQYEADRQAAGKVKPGEPVIPELFIIADKTTPYRLLFSVIASARAEEAGYRRFRLIVLEKGSAPPPAK